MTAVANTAFTAAQFNTFVRDNLNETVPAKATTASRYFIATGVNSIAEREINQDLIQTPESTTSTSFTDLATPGPSVTVTTGTAAILFYTAQMSNDTAGQRASVSYEVSGATSISPAAARMLMYESSSGNDVMRASVAHYEPNLTPGSNVFTLKYSSSDGSASASFQRRLLVVMAL